MPEKKQTVPFSGTKEQEETLLQVIAGLKDEPGALMPILQKAQDIYGYLPMEVQKMISDETGIPLEKIYGVVTFYSQFSLSPKGKYRISVCLGTACYVKAPETFTMRSWKNWELWAESVHRTESFLWMPAVVWEPADWHRL